MKKRTILMCAVMLGMAATIVSCCGKEEPATSQVNTTEAVINNIMQRKSVRSYTGEAIPADTLESILRCAMSAPTAMDVRPWHLVVMTDTSKYAELFAGNFNMEKFMQSGAVVILCADTTFTRAPRENPDAAPVTMPNRMWRDDLGACTENLLLAVEAYGLGACWTACYPYADRMDPVKAYLSLPGNVVPYAVVPIGVPAGENQPKDKWDTTRVHYNCW